MHIFKDVDNVPFYQPGYYLGQEKDSGMETYYYFSERDFKLLGGMHVGGDIRSFFEINQFEKLSMKELATDKGKNKLDLAFF